MGQHEEDRRYLLGIGNPFYLHDTSKRSEEYAYSHCSPACVNWVDFDGRRERSFDHFGAAGDQMFVSALGNNTVEVIDVNARVVVHTITGIPNPQGVVFSSEANKLFVGSSKGKLYIYDGTSFELIKEIDFHSDVDNLRYDPMKKRVYVGFGEAETGAIGTVDAVSNERLDEEYTLGTHPESFQLETSGPNIYANLPDLKQIAVINRSTHAITRWPLTLQLNFPMALDEADHRLFVGTRRPRVWRCSTRIRVRWSLRLRASKTRTTCITTPRANAFTLREVKGSSACSTERRGPLPTSAQGPVGLRRSDGWIFWKRKEGLRPFLFGGSGPCRPRRRSLDLHGTGLKSRNTMRRKTTI